MLGSNLLTRAATILQDADHVRWPLPELVRWVNDGQRAIVLAKPSANSVSVVFTLAQGTRQTLTDASHLALLRIPRNLKTSDLPRVGGRTVRPTTREILDASAPDWHDPIETPLKREVRQYVYDEEEPRAFYVYPGNDGTGVIELLVSVLPAALTASGDADTITSYAAELALPEPYPVILLDYVLYRSYAKDDVAGDASRATLHYQAFTTALGIKVAAETGNSPNARAKVTAT